MFDFNETLEQARQRNIHDALMEDMGICDWTAKLVPSKVVQAQLIVRQDAVLCGVDWFEGTLKKLDPNAKITWHYIEGDMMETDTKVCDISADAQALLSAERTCINFYKLCLGLPASPANTLMPLLGPARIQKVAPFSIRARPFLDYGKRKSMPYELAVAKTSGLPSGMAF